MTLTTVSTTVLYCDAPTTDSYHICTVLHDVISNDLEWLSKMSNDMKDGASRGLSATAELLLRRCVDIRLLCANKHHLLTARRDWHVHYVSSRRMRHACAVSKSCLCWRQLSAFISANVTEEQRQVRDTTYTHTYTAGPNIVDLLYLAGHFILSLNLTFKQKLKRYPNKKSAVAERPRDA